MSENIPGKISITIKINELPQNTELTKNGWTRFIVDTDPRKVQITIRPKMWNKLLKANEEFPEWVAAISGEMGGAIKSGFILEMPAVQIFEKKAKKPKESE